MIFRARLNRLKSFRLILALFVTLSFWGNPRMARSQSKFSFSSKTVNSHQSSVIKLTVEAGFCLNSSDECVQELTERAIANSHKLETLEERITLIEQRLELAEDRIEYTRKKKWTNYISANPVDIIQNIFGGGDVQRDNIAIAQRQPPADHAVPAGG